MRAAAHAFTQEKYMMRYTLALALTLALFASPAAADDPSLGAKTFTVYEGWLSPAQQPGEESEVPPPLKKSLGATAPSTPREQRQSRGHGRIRFARDLSKAYVDVEITGVDPADILMFHIHCGPPGFLGPIIVDLGTAKSFTNGKLSVEVANKDIIFVKQLPRGLKFHLPESCPSDAGFPAQVKTIAGLESLAKKGVLYFNLHTKAHTFYGEMRGQIYPATATQTSR
jgi:hypothetical protein